MIEREYNRFIPYCDECEDQLPEVNSFDEAVDELKEAGWTFKKYGGERSEEHTSELQSR